VSSFLGSDPHDAREHRTGKAGSPDHLNAQLPTYGFNNLNAGNGSASIEMSGTMRFVPGRLLWNGALAKVRLVPLPVPNWNPRFAGGTTDGLPKEILSAISVRLVPQPVWKSIVLSGFKARLVPPMEVANGELPGEADRLESHHRGKVAKVTGREIDVNSLCGCRLQDAVNTVKLSGISKPLDAGPAVGNRVPQMMHDRIVYGFVEVGGAVRPDHQNNVGFRSHCLRPFHIERDLVNPGSGVENRMGGMV
jgi:hypothetical protein